jgi:hypothetical protein
MKKFFLFRREQITLLSTKSSDDGVGLSVIALPADKLSFMTSTLGKVHFNFDDASIYDYATLSEGKVIDKTNISVSCKEGKEMNLMESVMNFMSANDKRNVLKFDSVKKEATLKDAKIEGFEDVSTIINATPVDIVTQKSTGSGDRQVGIPTVIADIDFLSEQNVPELDFNEVNLPSSAGQHIASWENSGLLGATHRASDEGVSNTLTVASNSVSTLSADIVPGNYFSLANTYTSGADYTIYIAFGLESYVNIYEFFGGSECKGFANGVSDIFSIRHKDRFGAPAFVNTNNNNENTLEYRFPSPTLETSNTREKQTMYVFVIRRDRDNNIFMHNFRGDVVGVIPAKTGGSNTTSGRTDGALEIAYFAGISGEYSFQGKLARFGVIARDIGANSARTLSQSLYKKYANNYSSFN